MKKFIKLILVSVLVFALCFSLSGCNMLDELKEAHAIRVDDETIEYKNNEYKLLPINEYFCPPIDGTINLHITDPDVPVLLSEPFGEIASLSEDKTIIEDYTSNLFYCRKDKYKKVKAEVESAFVKSGYCYFYTDYSDPEAKSDYYIFSDKENDAIENILAYGEVVVLDNYDYNCDYLANLEIYSRNLNFRKDFMQLCCSKGNYFLLDVDKDQQVMYKADSSLNQILSQAMKKADRYY